MKRLALALLCLAMPAVTATSALADTLFNFSFTGPTFSGSGEFTTTLQSAGTYKITDVSGSVDTGNGGMKQIAGVLAPGSYAGNDNLLFFPAHSGGNFFDGGGVSFDLSNGAEVNLYNLNGAYLMRANGNEIQESAVITVTPGSTSVTPEPGTLTLLGTGALGLVGSLRRRVIA